MVLLTAAHLPPGSVIGRGLRRMGGSASPRPLGEARDAGPRECMPSHDAIRLLQHAADVHQSSVGARDGYPEVLAPRLHCRVVQSSTTVRARRFGLLPRPPF